MTHGVCCSSSIWKVVVSPSRGSRIQHLAVGQGDWKVFLMLLMAQARIGSLISALSFLLTSRFILLLELVTLQHPSSSPSVEQIQVVTIFYVDEDSGRGTRYKIYSRHYSLLFLRPQQASFLKEEKSDFKVPSSICCHGDFKGRNKITRCNQPVIIICWNKNKTFV